MEDRLALDALFHLIFSSVSLAEFALDGGFFWFGLIIGFVGFMVDLFFFFTG